MRKKNHLKQYLSAIPSLGITFIIIGTLLLAASFALSLKNNTLLFAGLFFIIGGTIGFVYTLKQK